MEAADIARYVRPIRQLPVLHVLGENDLPYVRQLTHALAERYRDLDIEHCLFEVPGAGHFYPHTAAVEGADGEKAATLENSISEFLEQHLGSCHRTA